MGPNGAKIGDSAYRVECDLDLDGEINYKEAMLVGAVGGPRGPLSLSGSAGGWISVPHLPTDSIQAGRPDNTIGYCGYIYNAETALYTVRFRHYSPSLGRWLEPDPAGYVDGANLYEYGVGSPLNWIDPMGLDVGWARRPNPRPWGEPLENNDPPTRDQRGPIIDFEPDMIDSPPTDTVKIPRADRLRRVKMATDVLNRTLAKKGTCKCLTIAGHGGDGIFYLSGGDESGQVYLNQESLQNLMNYRAGSIDPRDKLALAEGKVLDDFFKAIERILEQGGTLEFAGCNAGGDKSGRKLGEMLSAAIKGRTIVLYLNLTRFVDGDLQQGTSSKIWHLAQNLGIMQLIPVARKFRNGEEISPSNPDYDRPSSQGKLKPAAGARSGGAATVCNCGV